MTPTLATTLSRAIWAAVTGHAARTHIEQTGHALAPIEVAVGLSLDTSTECASCLRDAMRADRLRDERPGRHVPPKGWS